jgi:NADH-quinone oxidoreductase subunit M
VAALGLNLIIFLPLAAAIAVWVWPQRRVELVPRFALWVGLLVLAIALGLWLRVTPDTGPGHLVGQTRSTWVLAGDAPGAGGASSFLLNVSYHVGLDPISAPLVLLTALLVPLSIAFTVPDRTDPSRDHEGAVLRSDGAPQNEPGFAAEPHAPAAHGPARLGLVRHRVREYYAWLLALTTGMIGVFAARDLLLFYVFFEFTLIPLYFLIAIWGGPQRRYAASKFFLYTFAGSVITFAGILYLAARAAEPAAGLIDFDLARLSGLDPDWPGPPLSRAEQWWLFLAFFCGFAIKVPLFPLHTWLPLAHTEAPTAGSVLLAGVLLKLGTYGFLRFSLPMVPEGAVAWAQFMGLLAVAGIIYGALCCWVQRDAKKLVAYSSVSHLGFCMLGLFSLLPVGLSGSVLYMVNHGISTGALFLVVGMVYERYHTRDIHELGGLAARMPLLAFFLVLFTLSSIGLPGLNGFVSEFTVLLAAFNSPALGTWYGVLGASGILLGAIYMLYLVGRLLFGPLREPPGTPDPASGLPRDLTRREIAILVPLAALVVLLGVAPRLITDTLDPALDRQVLARVESVAAPDLLAGRGAAPLPLTPLRGVKGLPAAAVQVGKRTGGP